MEKAARFVNKAADGGAGLVAMPEMWNCPYGNEYFPVYAERDGGPSTEFLSDLARKNEIFLVGGSIPEHADGRYYNTSYIYGPDGVCIGKHRKVHLFDIAIRGGISVKESDTLSPGTETTVVDTDFGKIGVAICFDVRFPDMFVEMADAGAHLIVLPASFNMTTGPVHWELLMRARAMDNQLYFSACAPARDLTFKYKSYAHSIIVDPWGEVRGAAAQEETVVYGEIDVAYMARVREELPLHRGR
jgi:predicted amidohydrolase